MTTTIEPSMQDFVAKCRAMALDMLGLPARQVWVDYDQEADVLYMSFRKPQRATKTVEVGDDILVRKDGRIIVGLTIMNASARRKGGKTGVGHGDYTKDRKKWMGKIDLSDLESRGVVSPNKPKRRLG